MRLTVSCALILSCSVSSPADEPRVIDPKHRSVDSGPGQRASEPAVNASKPSAEGGHAEALPAQPRASSHGPHDGEQPAWANLFYEALGMLTFGDLRSLRRREAELRDTLPDPFYPYVAGRLELALANYTAAIAHLDLACNDAAFYASTPDVWYYRGIAYSERGNSDRLEDGDGRHARESFEEFLALAGGVGEKRRDAHARLEGLSQVHGRPDPGVGSAPEPDEVRAPDSAEEGRETPPSAVIVWAEEAVRDELTGPGVSEPGAGVRLYSREGAVAPAQFDGSMLLLHFWASWCAPCIHELPALVDYLGSPEFAEMSRRGVRAVLVTADNFLGEGEAFLENLDLEAPRLYHDRDFALLRELSGGAKLPATILLRKKDREVLASAHGAVEWGTPDGRAWLLQAVDSGAEGGPRELSAR